VLRITRQNPREEELRVDMANMSSNGDTEELIEHMAPSWNLLYIPLSVTMKLIVQ